MPKIIKKISIQNAIADYLQFCSYKNLATKTLKSYSQTLYLFATWLEEEKQITTVNQLDKQVVEEYITSTKERGKYTYVTSEEGAIKAGLYNRPDNGKEISISTLNNYLRNIKAFASYLDDEEILINNIHKCKFLKQKRKPKEQLTDEEYKRLIRCLDKSKYHEFRDYVIINLIFDTGMRLSETLHLTINDISLSQKTILIPADISKNKKDRAVFFSSQMASLLQRWLKYKDVFTETDIIFPTQRTCTYLSDSNFERNFRIYLKRAKINKNITPHSLRNNFGRRFLLNGGSIFILSKILGHSSVKVTEQHYLDLLNEDIKSKYSAYSPLNNMD